MHYIPYMSIRNGSASQKQMEAQKSFNPIHLPSRDVPCNTISIVHLSTHIKLKSKPPCMDSVTEQRSPVPLMKSAIRQLELSFLPSCRTVSYMTFYLINFQQKDKQMMSNLYNVPQRNS